MFIGTPSGEYVKVGEVKEISITPTPVPPLSPPLTENKAREALTLLARIFKVPVPSLLWSTRTRRGHTFCISNEIRVGPHCVTDTLLHEFAHILNFRRLGCRVLRNAGGRRAGHDWRFVDALVDTAAAWYGDPARYGWSREYKSVYAWGRKRGLVDKGENQNGN